MPEEIADLVQRIYRDPKRPHQFNRWLLTCLSIRPIENQILAVDPRKLGDIDSRIVDMMGYKEMRPFMGYVDALNPRFGAKRMIDWLQQDVDYHPPTFAREHKL